MNINRNNYEEYFLLYVDNELSAEERKVVEEFVSVNTDLQEELHLLQDTVLKPEKAVTFVLKSSLIRSEVTGVVNESNCEEYFILYTDNELNETDKAAVEQFVETHPAYKKNFELIQLAKLKPETEIVFPDKKLLYRKEKDDKVVPFTWWKMMAAAVILLMAGLSVWYLFLDDEKKPEMIVQTPVVQTPSVADATAENKKAETVDSKDTSAPVKSTEQPTEKNTAQDQLALHSPVTEKSREKSTAATVRKIKPVHENTRKKMDVGSNISPPSNVTPTEKDVVVKTESKNPETAINDPKPEPNETVATTNLVSGTAEQYDTHLYTEESDKDIIYVANTSISKKNKLRGLVRKASRVFEKATSLEPVRNRGIRIANFEVGIK